MLIVDEGWLALDDPGFAGQLREWLKTLRKKNASVIFATQSLADIDGSAIAPAIIESCPTRDLPANERALEPQIAAIYRRFGLNDRQIEILSRATPKRDYYCQSRRGNRVFELGLSEVALAFTAASSKTDQTAIAEIVAAHGRDGFAAAWLRRKGLDWAADMLDPQPGDFTMNRVAFVPRSPPASPLFALATASVPAHAQWIVFDPTNFAQNMLTAARELQQVNNEIQILENQATSLINQAHNLASLPYSSLAQLEQSITQTQQLLTQAQRIAYSVTTIDQAFTRLIRRPIRLRPPSQQLIADAQTRWQNALAGFQDAMRVQAGVVQNLDNTRTQIDALVSSSQSATGALQAAQSGNQLVALADHATRGSDRGHGRDRPRPKPGRRAQRREPGSGAAQTNNFLNYGSGYQPGSAQMFH